MYSQLLFEEKGLNSPLSFYSLSYGSKQLLHLLILLENAYSRETICIEEPENHLHSHVQKKLFKRIVEKAKDKEIQFIITTHSPIFTGLEEGMITTLIRRENAMSKATPIENDSQLKLVKQHLGINNSDIYLSPYVIFVEGKSEEISIPEVGKAMGYDQIGKEIRIINFGGKNKIQNLTEFLKYIHYFETVAVVLADGHREIIDTITELKRGKLNFYDKIREQGREFEDQFYSNQIIQAMRKLAKEMLFKFDMDEEELEEKRIHTNVADIIDEHIKNQTKLEKTLLAKELTSIVVQEIDESNKKDSKRNDTRFEKEIRDIMQIIYPN